MARQRAGWGFTRHMEKLKMLSSPRKPKVSKYGPHANEGEKRRRLAALVRLKGKLAKRKGEINHDSE